MGAIGVNLDDVSKIAGLLKPIKIWASKSAVKRIFLVTCFGFVLLAIHFLYLNSLLDKEKIEGDILTSQIPLIIDESDYKSTLESIEICKASIATNNTNRDWYCEHAKTLYKKFEDRLTKHRVDEVVRRSAFEAMSFDITYLLRDLDFRKMELQAPRTEQAVLSKVLSTEGVVLQLTLTLLAFAIFLAWIYKQPTNPNKTK